MKFLGKNKRKFFLSLLIASAIFLFFPGEILATPPILTSYPVTITIDQEYPTEATMSGLSKNAVYRLRLTLSKPETSKYFGSTWNGSQWYNGAPSPINYQKFFTVTTDNEGIWSGEVRGKIESDDPNYKDGSGDYVLKLGRYTEYGSTATWSVPVTINLIDLTPTSTPIPTSEPTATPEPESEPEETSTPTPTPKPSTPTPTTQVVSPTPTPKKVSLVATMSGEVLSEQGEEATTAFYPLEATEEAEEASEATPSAKSASRRTWWPKVLLALGLIILFGTAFSLWYTQLR